MPRGALAALALGWAAAWLWGRGFDPRWWLSQNGGGAPEVVLSPAELGRYTGSEGSAGLYLAVLGQVFDVHRGRKHYGPGGAYSFFAGKDASRAFATGDFTPAGLVDDISGLSPLEVLTIQNWLSFYNKNYVHIGKVFGRFYDENGAPTEALRQAEALVAEGRRLQAEEGEKKRRFPPCNSEWSSSGGSRVWCSRQRATLFRQHVVTVPENGTQTNGFKRGGVHRDWSGVPRKLYEPGSSHSHCVCVKAEGLLPGQASSPQMSNRGDLNNPNLQEYEGCHPLSEWCTLKE